jgi:hypothetical protein
VDEDWVDEYLYGCDGLFNGGNDNGPEPECVKPKKRRRKSKR